MDPAVSIIVPTYNSEKYLRRCIDSVLNQEFTDFELLLADDGSSDSSGAICDEYAVRDARVRVLHKENTGVSDTRNVAMGEARGEWIQFIDSDDWITSDATKLFVRAATMHRCDMVIADFYRVSGERVSRKGDIDEDGVLSREEFAAHMMENPADFYYGVLWNKFYRRDLIEKYGLRMDPSINWCEDFLFNLEYLLHAEVFYALQAPIYYYVKRRGSLASQGMNISKVIRMKFTVFEYYNNFYKNVYDAKDYEKKRLSVYRFLVDSAGDGGVPPTILPGAKKLGDERGSASPAAVGGDGILSEGYRNRKLLERYLETAAFRLGLSLNESILLFYLFQPSLEGIRPWESIPQAEDTQPSGSPQGEKGKTAPRLSDVKPGSRPHGRNTRIAAYREGISAMQQENLGAASVEAAPARDETGTAPQRPEPISVAKQPEAGHFVGTAPQRPEPIICSRKELAELTGMTKNALSLALQKLSAKDYILVSEVREPHVKAAKGKKPASSPNGAGADTQIPFACNADIRPQGGKRLRIELLPAADAILLDFATVQYDFDASRFDGFTEDELLAYERLSEKIKGNIRRVLTP